VSRNSSLGGGEERGEERAEQRFQAFFQSRVVTVFFIIFLFVDVSLFFSPFSFLLLPFSCFFKKK